MSRGAVLSKISPIILLIPIYSLVDCQLNVHPEHSGTVLCIRDVKLS